MIHWGFGHWHDTPWTRWVESLAVRFTTAIYACRQLHGWVVEWEQLSIKPRGRLLVVFRGTGFYELQ